jgi:hypothetical protein
MKSRKKIVQLSFLCLLGIYLFSCQNRDSGTGNKNSESSAYLIDSQRAQIANTNLDSNTVIFPPKKQEKGHINNLYFGCGYNHEFSSDSLELYYPSDREIDEIKKIISYAGLPMNFDIYGGNIKNAMATIVNDRRIILYDQNLFVFADHVSNSYWTSMSILAHEIGHHLSGHTLNRKISSHKNELEADKFSGFTLYKMGASIEQSTLAIKLFGSELQSETHPNKSARIKAIEQGWIEAASLRYEGAVPPPPTKKIPEIVYTTKMLYGTENFIDNDIPMENSRSFVGTITEIDPDFNSGGIEIFTENSTGNAQDASFIKKKEMFMVPINMSLGTALQNGMSRADWSWYNDVLRPGRKIVFKYVAVGSGGFLYLTYIKVIR